MKRYKNLQDTAKQPINQMAGIARKLLLKNTPDPQRQWEEEIENCKNYNTFL